MKTATRQKQATHIRWLIRRDFAEVMAIERSSFSSPWSEDEFLKCLRNRNVIGMVALRGERIVGFMVYELHNTRLQLLNFAVREDARRQGVGTEMVKKLIGKLSAQSRTRITLEVRETNLDGQQFFKACGFRAVNVLHDFYFGTDQDAYRMVYAHRIGSAIAEIAALKK